MSSTIFAPGVSQALNDLHFHGNNEVSGALLISIFVVGLAVGPLFLSPLSELYGRTPLMHGSNVVFLLASVVCATSVNVPMLVVFRLIMGMSTISLGGGYVADLMTPEERGRAMNVWTVGPVLVSCDKYMIRGPLLMVSFGIGTSDRSHCRRLYLPQD